MCTKICTGMIVKTVCIVIKITSIFGLRSFSRPIEFKVTPFCCIESFHRNFFPYNVMLYIILFKILYRFRFTKAT